MARNCSYEKTKQSVLYHNKIEQRTIGSVLTLDSCSFKKAVCGTDKRRVDKASTIHDVQRNRRLCKMERMDFVAIEKRGGVGGKEGKGEERWCFWNNCIGALFLS